MDAGKMTERVIVLGAGLTGLTVAYRLAEAGTDVLVIERDRRVGGQIHTALEEGVTVELGAEGFVARSEVVPALCRDLGIGDQLIDQETTLTFALTEGQLVPLAPGKAAEILGFQVPKEELGRGIRSLRMGMGQLVDRLAVAVGDRSVRTGVGARSIRSVEGGLEVTLDDGGVERADAVVVTLPALCAMPVVEEIAGEAARALESGKRLSNASVTMLFERAAIEHPLEGSGFIVPAAAQTHGFRACSFVTSKFARPTPPGLVTLRAFFRPTDEDLASRDDATWVDLAVASVAGPLGITGRARRAWVSAWPRALPIYDEAYRLVVRNLEAALSPHRVHLAGSHYHGAGIDAAVASAERAARAVASRVR